MGSGASKWLKGHHLVAHDSKALLRPGINMRLGGQL